MLKTIINVIFVLSTIVIVTDCCSSRILLLREHTLKIVQHQHNFHNHLHEHAHQLQQQIEQHVANLVTQLEINKTRLQELKTDQDGIVGTAEQSVLDMTPPPNINWPPILPQLPANDKSVPEMVAQLSVSDDDDDISTTEASTKLSESDTTSLPISTSKFHIVDIYYAIMTNMLSLECSGQYLTEFCLNGGRCFRYPVGNHSFFSCECADGYIGERCESKSLNGLYVPTPNIGGPKPKILMARIVFSFPMLILLSSIYVIFGAFVVFRSPQATNGKKQHHHGIFIS